MGALQIIELIGQLLFISGGTILVYILHNLLKKINETGLRKSFTDGISFEKDSYCNAEVQRIIIRLKLELNACKVTLARFHNGGSFANGIDMKKFTVTHETQGGSNTPLMDKGVNVLNSRYGIAFETLSTMHQYIVSDVEDCLDHNFKGDMKTYGFKASYVFLMRQHNGIDEGMITISFKDTTVLESQQRDIIKEQIPVLLNLLNMNNDKYNKIK